MKENARNLPDDQIVDLVLKSKDTEFFGVLYDRHIRMVYSKCLALADNEQEAEDWAHDIFLKAFIKLNTFKSNSKFSTWLFSISINYCLDAIRKKNTNRKYISLGELTTAQNEIEDKKALMSVKAEHLLKILELIPPEDKILLLLKYQDELSIKDISNMLDISESGTKMRLQRARKKVIKIYKEKFEQLKELC